ncbi:MAG: sulfotransferase family 2 domain-containing protein [Microcystaceae cyanobacterium]
MLLSKKQKFIFIHVYKNAGTSITTALEPLTVDPWQQLANNILNRLDISSPFNPQPFPDHATAPEVIEIMGKDVFDSYFSFAIVRNPWDWQVSLYKYMLKYRKHPKHDLVKSFADFDEYVIWRCSHSQEFKVQKDFIYSQAGELLVDFVGRFETLDTDFSKICDRIGISTTLPKLNISNTKPYQEFYNEKTKELVRDTFKEDIELFGYDFN